MFVVGSTNTRDRGSGNERVLVEVGSVFSVFDDDSEEGSSFFSSGIEKSFDGKKERKPSFVFPYFPKVNNFAFFVVEIRLEETPY